MEPNIKNTTIADLTKVYFEFLDQRGWKPGPRSLIISMLIELGELAEYFQWEDMDSIPKKKQKQIMLEMIDVFNYFLQFFRFFPDKDLDFVKIFYEKLEKLKQKYPVGIMDEDWHKVHDNYRKNGKSKLYED